MESLLLLSFDNVSSKDPSKIRKGLRQIEGLLAQICLAKAAAQSPSKRQTATAAPVVNQDGAGRKLSSLSEDLAFREFFKLQDNFEWNVATRLVETLERLLSMRSNPANDQLIVSGMDLVHGLLLLHPASRSLFGREMYMNLLLDLLDPLNLPAIILSTISALTSALLAQPRNIRTFEACDGLQTITSLFKSRGVTSTPVLQSRINEFLHFYLLPETTTGSNSTLQEASQSEQQLGSPSKGPVRSASNSGMIPTKLTAEKAKLLASYLGGGNGNGNGAARATAADHEADGMMQGLRTGRALGVVVAV